MNGSAAGLADWDVNRETKSRAPALELTKCYWEGQEQENSVQYSPNVLTASLHYLKEAQKTLKLSVLALIS